MLLSGSSQAHSHDADDSFQQEPCCGISSLVELLILITVCYEGVISRIIFVIDVCFPVPRPHHRAERFWTCLSDIVILVSRLSRVLVFAYFGCMSESDLADSVPHLPHSYADMVHARAISPGIWSCNQSIRDFCSFVLQGLYYCCLPFQRIRKKSKNNRWDPSIGGINDTKPRDLVACRDVYSMCPFILFLGLHSFMTSSPVVLDVVETLHDGNYQKNHKEAESELPFCFCCTWILGGVHLVSHLFFSFCLDSDQQGSSDKLTWVCMWYYLAHTTQGCICSSSSSISMWWCWVLYTVVVRTLLLRGISHPPWRTPLHLRYWLSVVPCWME